METGEGDTSKTVIKPLKIPTIQSNTSATNHVKFDLSLHMNGLNRSFADHIKKILSVDPSKDISEYFETYKIHLQTIISKSENSQTSSTIVTPLNKEAFLVDSNSSYKPFPSTPGNPISSSFNYTDKMSSEVGIPKSHQPFIQAENSPKESNLIVSKESSNNLFKSPSTFSFFQSSNETASKEPFSFNFLKNQNPERTPFSSIQSSTTIDPSSISASASPFSFLTSNPSNTSFSTNIVPKNTEPENKDENNNSEDDEQSETPTVEEIDPYVKGSGEESDSVLLAYKCKIFTMTLSQAEKNWQDLGVAALRINQTQLTEPVPKYRIISRAQGSTAKLLLNSYISGISLMPLKPTDKGVSFICMNPEDKLTCYLIRVKSEESIQELYSTLEKYSKKNST